MLQRIEATRSGYANKAHALLDMTLRLQRCTQRPSNIRQFSPVFVRPVEINTSCPTQKIENAFVFSSICFSNKCARNRLSISSGFHETASRFFVLTE